MVKKSTIFSLLHLLAGCILVERKEEGLTFEKRPYNGAELALNGYYYEEDSIAGNNVPVYFLYNNGIIMCVGAYRHADFERLEREVTKSEFMKKSKSIPGMWGLFRIGTDSISFETWYPASGGYVVGIRSGKIINDTTFMITRYKHSHSDYENTEKRIYHFKEFSPKPDSTNNLIM